MAAGLILTLTGCSDDSAAPTSTTSTARALDLVAFRANAPGESDHCAVAYDIGAAARAAHLTGVAAAAGPTTATGDQATAPDDKASAALADPAHSTLSPLEMSDGVYADCSYRVGQTTVVVRTYAVRRGSAINLAAPQIQREDEMTVTALSRYLERVGKSSLGTALVAVEHVAAARVPVRPEGNGAITVTASGAPVTAEQLTRLTESLAAQVS
ncbi:hypothetical protein VV02_00455 [Luteipulveratus mongoliensis]|uniref:Uncharacterized protein n=1 Tax=Luteipulveratus mongoliensis TaxID=571913 RepID=A0A0K1JDP1_9MICO|nr:hypothetical protein VV02_00455 [Luteipulveratus mongoliensis]